MKVNKKSRPTPPSRANVVVKRRFYDVEGPDRNSKMSSTLFFTQNTAKYTKNY
jgi:hypothetical protein